MQKHSEGFVMFAIYAHLRPILRLVEPSGIGILPDLTESRSINA